MYVSARPLVEIQNLQEIFASTHLLTAEIVTHAPIWRGRGGGVQVLYPPPGKIKNYISSGSFTLKKKMNITKLNQLHLANELAIHNFKHQNFKDTQTLNFGQAKNENKNKHNHYYGRQPHNLDKKSHAIICMLTKY